jgi:hypothetical protein
LLKIATGREARPPELDTFAAAFAVARQRPRKRVADKETAVLLKRFSGNPAIEKARAEFKRAQKAEEKFHKDFNELDFTMSAANFRTLALARVYLKVAPWQLGPADPRNEKHLQWEVVEPSVRGPLDHTGFEWFFAAWQSTEKIFLLEFMAFHDASFGRRNRVEIQVDHNKENVLSL